MNPNKACPVVLRLGAHGLEILAFEHPLAGYQLVKGSIEGCESLADACTRELLEESGVRAVAKTHLGQLEIPPSITPELQIWGFYVMELIIEVPNCWEHFTNDGGGLVFKFFWQPLNQELDSNWPAMFRAAIEFIKTRV